ncbi:MAG: DnaJ C-terminal domain-containing protein [Planctomycetota bacterium]
MPGRDFYEVLGIKRGADADEIKRAYRALARVHHPDVSKADDAQARFTEIQEAYDVLSDPEKRRLYDRVGRSGYEAGAAQARGGGASHSWSNAGGAGFGGGGFGGGGMDAEELEDLFGTFFGGRSGGGGGGFAGASGQRARAGRRPGRAPGADIEHEITIPFDLSAKGGTYALRLDRPGAKSTSIDVKIPKAVADGARLRVRGEGQAGRGGAGDLIIRVRVSPHPTLKRDGLDLRSTLRLNIAEAALGAEREVKTVESEVTVRVPPGTPSGRTLRLRGAGLKDAAGRTGDLYAEIEITPPDASDWPDEDRETLRRLAGD